VIGSAHEASLATTYCALEERLLSKEGAWKDFPFGLDYAVFKVADRMFALIAWRRSPLYITLKCDPHDADFLRQMFDAVRPGIGMHKDHWNTITLDGSVPEGLLLEMIDSSYGLVVRGLPKTERERLATG
jgi:predicted DNA-binding protein (MmcQ/YjbR family)